VVEGQTAAPALPQNHPNLGPGQQTALGSGFVWDTAGHIVTNNHVVDGATQISVTFADGTTASAKLVGADPDSDLAVIQVSVPASQLHPVQVGDSTQVKVGQFAIAIGNPYGEQNTMTTGIISALGRSLPVENPVSVTQGGTYSIPDVIQTDASINPGNSGGVLLNSDGQVIGVTAAIESPNGTSAGIGFAIPSAIVQRVIPALIKTGHYDHPYLGISGTTLKPGAAQAMNLKSDQRGALVISVTPNGPSAKAGVQGGNSQTTVNGLQAQIGGDVITAIDNQPVKSFDDIVAYLARSTNVNQTVTLTILRNGKEQTIKVILSARPGSST
jgi:serine protease Do